MDLSLDGRASASDQYLDPVSIGGLIVSVATLAWTVYTDSRKQKKAPPSAETVLRTIRVQVPDGVPLHPAIRERIVEVVVAKAARVAAEDAVQN